MRVCAVQKKPQLRVDDLSPHFRRNQLLGQKSRSPLSKLAKLSSYSLLTSRVNERYILSISLAYLKFIHSLFVV